MEWLPLLKELGFPVALCIFLLWQFKVVFKKSDDREKKLVEALAKAQEDHNEDLRTIVKDSTAASIKLGNALRNLPCFQGQDVPVQDLWKKKSG